ncbi:MAG: cytochrome c [Akkermansiaceae bacterium]
MSEQYSNHRDTPLRRFNTFWWGLGYFGLFGLVSVIVYWMTDTPSDVEDMRKTERLQLRDKVDQAQGELLKDKDTSAVADKVVTTAAATETFVPGTKAHDEAMKALSQKTGGGPGFDLYTAKTCNTCHGADANTPLAPNYPKLAGQNAEYLVAQMKDFAASKRTNGQSAIMTATIMAQKVTDEDSAKIADWLSKLDAPKVDLVDGPGKDLYTAKLCATCHGPDGNTPIMPLYPKIAGQNSQYLIDQMKAIKDGTRNNGQSMAMKAIMANVSDEEIKTISEWLEGKK